MFQILYFFYFHNIYVSYIYSTENTTVTLRFTILLVHAFLSEIKLRFRFVLNCHGIHFQTYTYRVCNTCNVVLFMFPFSECTHNTSEVTLLTARKYFYQNFSRFLGNQRTIVEIVLAFIIYTVHSHIKYIIITHSGVEHINILSFVDLFKASCRPKLFS